MEQFPYAASPVKLVGRYSAARAEVGLYLASVLITVRRKL